MPCSCRRIPDFSGVGYLYGADIPTQVQVGGLLVELTQLAHEALDQSARIQVGHS